MFEREKWVQFKPYKKFIEACRFLPLELIYDVERRHLYIDRPRRAMSRDHFNEIIAMDYMSLAIEHDLSLIVQFDSERDRIIFESACERGFYG